MQLPVDKGRESVQDILECLNMNCEPLVINSLSPEPLLFDLNRIESG